MNDTFPEAGAVAFFAYKRTDGYIINLTLRDVSGKEVLERIDGAIAKIKEQGGTPYERQSGFKKKEQEFIDGRVCPIDKGRLVKPSAPNRPIKCENSKYDFQTKQSSGCAFVEWPKPAETQEADMGDVQSYH